MNHLLELSAVKDVALEHCQNQQHYLKTEFIEQVVADKQTQAIVDHHIFFLDKQPRKLPAAYSCNIERNVGDQIRPLLASFCRPDQEIQEKAQKEIVCEVKSAQSKPHWRNTQIHTHEKAHERKQDTGTKEHKQ